MVQKKMVLILRPHANDPGGVANYYNLVNKYFNSELLSITQFFVGKDRQIVSKKQRIQKTVNDFKLLCATFNKFDLIVFNPSLDIKALLRDGLLHLTAKHIYKKRTVVFFRGWLQSIENGIDKHGKTIFKFIFNSDKICVLSKQIKAKLIEWGYKADKIIVETTTFEGQPFQKEMDLNKIIFLARFVKRKGCFHAIKTIEILIKDFPSIHLFMVGDGELMGELTSYVKKKKLENYVTFAGYVSGKHKYNIIQQCGIMLFPTFYDEGMPNSLLEGMGMGLVPVTRPVGGIADIIENGRNGFLVNSSDPNDFASKINCLLLDHEKWQSTSNINLIESRKKFEIKNVVKRLEKIYHDSI